MDVYTSGAKGGSPLKPRIYDPKQFRARLSLPWEFFITIKAAQPGLSHTCSPAPFHLALRTTEAVALRLQLLSYPLHL
jgi:hypothetical protein